MNSLEVERKIWEEANIKKTVPVTKGIKGRKYGLPFHMPYVPKDNGATAYDVEDVYETYMKEENEHGIDYMCRKRMALNENNRSSIIYCILIALLLVYFCPKIVFIPVLLIFLIRKGNKKPQALVNLYFYLRENNYGSLDLEQKIELVSMVEFLPDKDKQKMFCPSAKDINNKEKLITEKEIAYYDSLTEF